MHATIGAACWSDYTFRNTFSIKLHLHNYVRPVCLLSISIYTYIQAAMLNKTGDVTLEVGGESPCIPNSGNR